MLPRISGAIHQNSPSDSLAEEISEPEGSRALLPVNGPALRGRRRGRRNQSRGRVQVAHNHPERQKSRELPVVTMSHQVTRAQLRKPNIAGQRRRLVEWGILFG
jgi:hypothetical protein